MSRCARAGVMTALQEAPGHADAAEAWLSRWTAAGGVLLTATRFRHVTTDAGRGVGRTPIVVGDEVRIVERPVGRADTLARIVRRAERQCCATWPMTPTHRTGGGRQRRSAAHRGGLADPAAPHRVRRQALIAAYAGGLRTDPVPHQIGPRAGGTVRRQFIDLDLTVVTAGRDGLDVVAPCWPAGDGAAGEHSSGKSTLVKSPCAKQTGPPAGSDRGGQGGTPRRSRSPCRCGSPAG